MTQTTDDDFEEPGLIGWLFMALIVAAVVILIMFWPGIAKADVGEYPGIYCVIGESEGQTQEDMTAIACALKERGTIKGVYGCNSKRVKNRLYSSKILVRATKAWNEATPERCLELVGDANSWYSLDDIDKHGHQACPITAKIDNFVFYQCRL